MIPSSNTAKNRWSKYAKINTDCQKKRLCNFKNLGLQRKI